MHFPPRPRGRGHLAQPIAARAALGSAPLPAAVPNQSAAGEWAGRAGGARPDGRTGGGPAQVPLAPRCPLGSRSPPSLAMAAAVAGLRASYHRMLDRIELMLPPRFRPFYNHPAGNRRGSPWFPLGRRGGRSGGCAPHGWRAGSGPQ